MDKNITEIANKSMNELLIDHNDAKYLLNVKGENIYDLLYWANKIRFKFFQNNIVLCAILSAKQGNCSEDCKFCAQSSLYENNDSTKYTMVNIDKTVDAALLAEKSGAESIGLVTSGYGLKTSQEKTSLKDSNSEFKKFCKLANDAAKKSNIPIHASIGCMSEEMAKQLADSGVEKINHNLETSRTHFSKICTTHTYDERLSTIKNAKNAGLKICSGGIFGIGESIDDVIELAFTLKELNVDTIPLNFLNPITGTPLGNNPPLNPMEILKTVAFFRFALPNKEIKLAGGRETNLRELQSWMFYAGANSTMIGDYLTTKGKNVNEDLQMIKDLELSYTICK